MQKYFSVKLSARAKVVKVAIREKVSSFNFIFVQFYPLMQKYRRAILYPSANLTATPETIFQLLLQKINLYSIKCSKMKTSLI